MMKTALKTKDTEKALLAAELGLTMATEGEVTMVYTIIHPPSSLAVLHSVKADRGPSGLDYAHPVRRVWEALGNNHIVEIKAGSDVALRLPGTGAGTHKIVDVAEALKRIIPSPLGTPTRRFFTDFGCPENVFRKDIY